MSRKTLLLNGNFVTLDEAMPHATAVVLRGDEIVYVGDNDGAHRQREQDCEVIDLNGRLALPAFTDAHIHFTGWAQSLENVDLNGCHSLEEAVERVRARATQTPEGTTLRGGGWNNADWVNPEFPDRRSLDKAAPKHAVILTRKDGHSVWLNSQALQKAHITRDTDAPEGGIIDKDDEGEPSGILRENAQALLGGGIGSFAEQVGQETLLRGIQKAHATGITTIHNIEGASALRAFEELHTNGALTMRVVHSIPHTNLSLATKLGVRRGLGDEWLKLQAVKIFADGSLGSHTAEMREPFLDTPGNRGVAVTNPETMLATAREAVSAGIDVWIHAIGDYAITRVLDVFAQLRHEGFDDVIFRVEHVQHLDPSDLPRFRELNVIASMQPIHQPSDMWVADRVLGKERAQWTYAARALQEAGATLAFGSDCPVEPLDPLPGIHAAVTRQNDKGEPAEGWYPQQRIAVMDAVKGFTRGGAKASGDLKHAGSLSVGKRGDVVVLDQDIFNNPPQEILTTQITHTISGGNVVFAA